MMQQPPKRKIWSDKPLPRYEAKPLRENGIGYLADSRGNRLPSYNFILEATKTPTDKARLSRWRKQVGSATASQIISTAIQRGKLGHRHLECYFQNENTPCPELIKPHWEHLLPLLQQINEVKLVEGNVFHYYEGYAGRVDCVANFYDIPCVIDFKFADRIKPLYDEPLQLAAYCGALNRQYGLMLKHAFLVVVTPDEAEVTLFEGKELTKYWCRWQQKVAQFWRQRQLMAS